MQQSGRLDTFGKKQAMYYKVRFFVISHPIWSRELDASNVSLVSAKFDVRLDRYIVKDTTYRL